MDGFKNHNAGHDHFPFLTARPNFLNRKEGGERENKVVDVKKMRVGWKDGAKKGKRWKKQAVGEETAERPSGESYSSTLMKKMLDLFICNYGTVFMRNSTGIKSQEV